MKERQEYLARLGSDLKWGRPTEKTTRFVWELLKDKLPIQLDDLLPRSKSERPSGAEYNQCVLIAKQSLVVALDCAITAAGRRQGRGAMLTQNLLLEALAKYWSIRFRQATRRGVHTLYDVREETASRVWREMLLAGVRVDTLWNIVTGTWSRTEKYVNFRALPIRFGTKSGSCSPPTGAGWRSGTRPRTASSGT